MLWLPFVKVSLFVIKSLLDSRDPNKLHCSKFFHLRKSKHYFGNSFLFYFQTFFEWNLNEFKWIQNLSFPFTLFSGTLHTHPVEKQCLANQQKPTISFLQRFQFDNWGRRTTIVNDFLPLEKNEKLNKQTVKMLISKLGKRAIIWSLFWKSTAALIRYS